MPKIHVKRDKGNPPPVARVGFGQPLYTGAASVFPYTRDMVEQFSYESKFAGKYTNYKVLGKNTSSPRIAIPRTRGMLGLKDKRIIGTKQKFGWFGTPRNDEQVRVLEEMDDCYDRGSTGLIIEASTGFGKTFLGCYAIQKVQCCTLVLVTKSDLEGQWRKAFELFLGLKPDEIGLIKGDVCDTRSKRVVVGYVQSVMKEKRYPSWVYKLFGMVIADEVHLLAADKFSNCMWQLGAKYRLGLSATLDRSDGREHVFKDHIGRVKIVAALLPMAFDVIVVKTQVIVPETVPFKPGRSMGLNNFLGQHPSRQKAITSKIIKAYEKDRNIVAFADTKVHLEYAYQCLVDAGVRMSDIGFYVGHEKPPTKEDKLALIAQAHKRIVLATYKMTAYGTDFPHWDTAVLMTPKADVRQIVGRVIREPDKGKTKKKPVVIDVVDPIWMTQNYFASRLKWYELEADTIVGVN